MAKRLACLNGKETKGLIHSPLDLVQGTLISIPEYVQIETNNYQVFHAEEQQEFVLVRGKKFVVGNEVEALEEVSGARIYSIPMGSLLSVCAQSNDVEAISLSFYPTFNLCLGSCPNSLGKPTKYAEREILGDNKHEHLCRHLVFTEGLERWFETVKGYLAYAYTDLFLYELKLQELFRLLNLEYTHAMLHNFITDLHCKESGFRRRIFGLRGRPISLEELAKYMDMSESILKRRFLSEFGMPPQKWLALQRSRYIFRDIIQSNAPIKDIAERYKFSTTSYLSLFCKKYLGDTPQNIRKRFSEE